MDLIVTSGGLGPTADDLTAEVVARFAGRELVLDEEMEEKIAEILRGFAAPLQLRRGGGAGGQPQAGDGARGGDCRSTRSAPRPGLVVPAGERVVIVLPGPAARAAADVAGGARDRAGPGGARERATPLRGYTLRMFGDPGVGDRQEPARDRGRRRRRSTRSRSRPACAAARSRSTSATATRPRRPPRRCATGLAERHERHLFSLDGETIDSQVASLLAGRRLGLAESCSGGLLAARITNLPGASAYFAGSVVAYSNEAKAELLGVDPALIEAHGRGLAARSPRRWRMGALERFGADVAVSITGIAGPDGGTRGEAGRLRLLQRPPRRRHRDRPRPGHPRRPRRHPRTLGPGRDAPAADPARRRRAAALERESARDSWHLRALCRARRRA